MSSLLALPFSGAAAMVIFRASSSRPAIRVREAPGTTLIFSIVPWVVSVNFRVMITERHYIREPLDEKALMEQISRLD